MKRRGEAFEADYYNREWKIDFRERYAANKLAWGRRYALAQRAKAYVVGSVLELGCGFGFLAKYVKGPYLGIDFSSFVVEAAREINANPQAEFLVGDIRDLPPLGQFDTVAMLEVLEHLDDPPQAVEIARQLARRRIVISVPRKMSRAISHVWPIWSQEDVENILGPGALCQEFRRWWVAMWENLEL